MTVFHRVVSWHTRNKWGSPVQSNEETCVVKVLAQSNGADNQDDCRVKGCCTGTWYLDQLCPVLCHCWIELRFEQCCNDANGFWAPEERHEISLDGGVEETRGSTERIGMEETSSTQLKGANFMNNKSARFELSCNSVTTAASAKQRLGALTMMAMLTRSFWPARQTPDSACPNPIQYAFSFVAPSSLPTEQALANTSSVVSPNSSLPSVRPS